MHNYNCILVVVLALFWSTTNAQSLERKFVDIELTTNWKHTPLLFEACEFAASESNQIFWNFIEKIEPKETSNDKEEYDNLFSAAENVLSDIQQDALRFALNLRFYSPKVEMYRQIMMANLQETNDLSTTCKAFVIQEKRIICDVAELNSILSASNLQSSEEVHPFDHIFPSSNSNSDLPTIILYGEVGSQGFNNLHAVLKQNAKDGKIRYVLRYAVPSHSEKINLAGYGAELALKNLEYKSVDDSKVEGDSSHEVTIEEEEEDIHGILFGVLQKRKPELSSELANLKSYLLASNEQFENLKVWHLKDIGYQASQRIASSTNPLKLLRELSQNFPSHAISLSRVKVNSTFREEIKKNHLVEEGKSIFLINGRVIDPDKVDPFSLYGLLREESAKLDLLTKMHLKKDDAFKVLSVPPEPPTEELYRITPDPAISFLNDLESDPQYHGWPRTVNEIFRRVWPGSFRYIGKNFFTAVVFLNPSTKKGLELVNLIDTAISQNIPIRWGVVMTTTTYQEQALKIRQNSDTLESNNAVKLLRIFSYLKDHYGTKNGFHFLKTLYYSSGGVIERTAQFKSSFENTMYRLGKKSDQSFEDIIEDTTYDSWIANSNQFAYDLGIDCSSSPVGFLNGALSNQDNPQEFIHELITKSFYQVANLQNLVRNRVIVDSSDIYSVLMSQSNLATRYSRLVKPSEDRPLKFVILTGIDESPFEPVKNLKYIMEPSGEDLTKTITHWLVVDLSTEDGVTLVTEAISSLSENSQNVRVGILHKMSSDESVLARAIQASLESQKLRITYEFVQKLLQVADVDTDMDTVLQVAEETGVKLDKFKAVMSDTDKFAATVNSHRTFCSDVLKVPTSSQAIITNGRVLEIPTGITFTAADFTFLSSYEHNQRSKKIEEILSNEVQLEGVQPEDQTSDLISDIIMKVASIMGTDEQNGVQKFALPPNSKLTLELKNSDSESYLITAIINPLSKAAQRFTPILEALYGFFDVRIQIILNPKEESNLPLSHFYSYAIPTDIEFDKSTGQLVKPRVKFNHLPINRLMTLNLDVPESWLVTPVETRWDLDNIKLSDLGSERLLYARFDLQNILVEGNCFEIDRTGAMVGPPRGLELVLSSSSKSMKTQDTIVMSNFGYYQLKANPALWTLRLKEHSRSEFIYEMTSEIQAPVIPVDSFLGTQVRTLVRKKADKVNEQLLGGSDSQDSQSKIWDSISELWKPDMTNETIHVFSLASGHLYERFLKIMMLSVVKNTQNPVKFWLLANFLSPKFKDSIPALSKEYNFDYELVTYKWPAWLHKQTEKQRIIWGYKILFLDVLFPLDLKKVVYVDADQVVRADLKELYLLDMEGAPYAYTPFCAPPNDNHDTHGFRFWDSGFWANHLHGLPYHISALYVIDLVQFRKQAAGDQLRISYAQLSQDPNSLANLDQDLPNYLQHQVKIKSLPQEWLWCETWCSQESKTRAKTIDLCNNPLTKIPKLEAAVKIIPEWTKFDNDVRATEKNVNVSVPKEESPQEHLIQNAQEIL